MTRLIALLVAILLLLVAQAFGTPSSGITARYGTGFYSEEVWGYRKTRRWMRQVGEVELANGRNSGLFDIGLYVESFRIPRDMEVLLRGHRVGAFRAVPGAQLFQVLRGLVVPAGSITLTFRSLQPPDRISAYRGGSDHREVTVALSPLWIFPSGTPEARRMQPSAFPGSDVQLAFLSPEENQGHELRREGRLLEAWDVLASLAQAGHAHAITYPVAGLVALALDDLEGARAMFHRGGQTRGMDPLSVQARRISAELATYLGRSELILRRSEDPGLPLRQKGEIYRAVALYRSALARRSCDLHAAYWLGLLLALAERWEEAGSLFRCVIEQRPDSADARMLRILGGSLFIR